MQNDQEFEIPYIYELKNKLKFYTMNSNQPIAEASPS